MSDMAPDQSMEDILASIKRVMARDPLPGDTAPPRRRRVDPVPSEEDVLELREEDRDGLTSPATVQASRDKLQALGRVEAAPEPRGTSVEALVAELMRPLLRDWLDEHLPAIVEAAVEREVRRITRG